MTSRRHIRPLLRAVHVPKKQGKSHHQYEIAIHGAVQAPRNGQTYVSRPREIHARVVQRRDVGSVRLSVDRSETGNTGRPATAHDHLSGRRRSLHLPDEDIKEQSRHSSRHLRDVGVHENTRVVSAVAREKEEREI